MNALEIIFLGTGAGLSTTRAHTAIALRCPDGTTLLLDGSSGNSALRNGEAVGIRARDYDHVLLSHDHQDHLSGLMFVQGNRSRETPDETPLSIYGSSLALEGLRKAAVAGKSPRYSRRRRIQPQRQAGHAMAGNLAGPQAGTGAGNRGLVLRRCPHPRLRGLANRVRRNERSSSPATPCTAEVWWRYRRALTYLFTKPCSPTLRRRWRTVVSTRHPGMRRGLRSSHRQSN